MNKAISFAILLAMTLGLVTSSVAMVGHSGDGSKWAPHVVMVLSHSGTESGFCSGAVIGRNAVLTAAHCVSSAANTRVYFRAASGEPKLLSVARVEKHPGFRATVLKVRKRSVDLAVLQTQEALGAGFEAAEIGDAPNGIRSTFSIVGFGVATEGDPKSSGVLRLIKLALRPPLSTLLLWLEAPDHNGAGACTGDSGAPVFAADDKLVAIVAFAEGVGREHCGKLTQAVRVEPFADWIRRAAIRP